MRCRCYKCDLNEDGYCSEANYVCICEDGTCDRMFIRSEEPTQTTNENLGGKQTMREIQNFDTVQPSNGEFAKPGPGGYILEIVSVEDVPFSKETNKGDYLKIYYDIADGDFRGYYQEQAGRFNGAWYANFIRSYKEKALGMFKHFINCVTESNPGFRWAWQEQALVRRRFGAVLQEEEYEKKDGSVGVRLIVKEIKTVQQILNGDFKIPDRKCLSASNGATPAPVPTSGFGAFAPGGSSNFAMLDASEDVSLPF